MKQSIFYLLLFCSCSNLKYLSKDEVLFTGSEISVNCEDPANKKAVQQELQKITKPNPNKKFLGLRSKLWFYNVAGADAKKGVRKWLRNKAGEPPVLLSAVDPMQCSEKMGNRLNGMGYFGAEVQYNILPSNKKAIIEYKVTLNSPYIINKIDFPSEKDVLSIRIKSTQNETLIKEGAPYNLDRFINERDRIDVFLKNNGFYYFNPDYLLFKADSTAGKKSIYISLTVKPEIANKAKIPYYFNNIYIIPSDTLNSQIVASNNDTLLVDGYYYINRDNSFKPSAIIQNVVIKKGDEYSRKSHILTISNLMGMGVFKFVNIKFKESIVENKGLLDAYIQLTPIPEKSLKFQLDAATKSTNYTGPGITLGFKNRNLFKGAELFNFNLLGSFETQFSGSHKGQSSFETGANAQFFFPKFVPSFKEKNKSNRGMKTKLNLGFRMLSRIDYFNMNALNFSYGYTWKESAKKEFEINPLLVNFASLSNTTPQFRKLLSENFFLQKSFREQFTLGSKSSFTFHSTTGLEKKSLYYFNTSLDLSGNTLFLLQSLMGSQKSTYGLLSPDTDEEFYKFSGYRYSQYSKISTDTRYYLTFNTNHKIATRLILGLGIPYGNSNTLPYLIQFFSGGPNSIRAFQARNVGPGSYSTPDSLLSSAFMDHAGDLKLEWNLEYRFTIISIVKGALFTDAGNVWLIRKNSESPEKEFHLNKFQNQMAVGTGVGIRADVSIFVLRFDLAIPLRIPTLPENERWVLDKISFGNKSWRKDNLVLNIAIGYPF